MSRFRYSAVDTGGRTHRGQIEAVSQVAARETLRGRGLLPVSMRASAGLGGLSDIWKDMFETRLKKTDVAIFTRQMATLVTGGVQIEAALSTISQQSTPRLGRFCQSARTAILDGGSLSSALQSQGGSFDSFYLTSVRSGEQSGQIGPVLEHLAEHVETAERHRQTVVLALIYPTILVVVSVAVVIALLVFVLPDIVRVFAARGADLPPLTRIMIGLSDVVSSYGVVMLLGFAGVLGGSVAAARRPAVRHFLHQVIWRAGLARQMVLVQFSGTLATLTQSGVPLTDALAAATATVGNLEARGRLLEVTREVQEGAALSRALSAQPGFPPMMVTMIASGEASGNLPAMLGRFWADQSQSLQARIKALVGLVEPLVLLVMGGVVMLLVLAILLPIINLNSLVG